MFKFHLHPFCPVYGSLYQNCFPLAPCGFSCFSLEVNPQERGAASFNVISQIFFLFLLMLLRFPFCLWFIAVFTPRSASLCFDIVCGFQGFLKQWLDSFFIVSF